MEDTIQCQQKQRQLQAECPDFWTMETYQNIQEAGQDSNVEMPPQSTIDTDSDGRQLGVENISFEVEDEDNDDMYAPAVDEDDEESEETDYSDASVEQGKTSKKKQAKKEKVRI